MEGYSLSEVISTTVGQVINLIIDNISEPSSSDSDDDDDEVYQLAMLACQSHKRTRVKVRDFVSVVKLYDNEDFRSHFRLDRASVEKLMQMLVANKPDRGGQRRPKVDFQKSILLFLWTISNQESFRGVADRFDLGRGHAHRLFMSMCEEVSLLVPVVVKWPTGADMERTLQEFEDMRGPGGFPGIIGCIDVTHIEIPGPKGENSYYNRNKYHSISLQGICDASGAFIDIYFGWPGSVHDARVWQHSPLCNKLQTEPNFLPENVHIAGDSAYPLGINLMCPYKDNGFLTPKQRKYNRIFSSKRVVIENAFAWLKERCRRLKYLDMINLPKTKYVVMAACVLHNICVWQRINNYEPDVDPGLHVPFGRYHDPIQPIQNNLDAAKRKRDAIADMLF